VSNSWSQGSDTRWSTYRLSILARDQWTCQIQGQGCTVRALPHGRDAGHVDHIVELSQGGAKYDPDNCRASCRTCNLRRKRTRGHELLAEPPHKHVSNW
jgi:5-methylcytosine-specific restriction endonuclease McrA